MQLSHVNSIIAPLIRTLTAEFYRLNSGFFLLTGTLAFGFMSKVEHLALAQVIVSSPYTLVIALGVWMMYAAKIVSFNGRQLQLPENFFLSHLCFVSLPQKVACALVVFALQFLPALAYGAFLVTAASPSPENFYIIIMALVAHCAIGVTALLRDVRLPRMEKTPSKLTKFLDRRLHKSVVLCYTEHVMRREPVMVVATKIFSGALIIGVCNLYRYEPYDGRLLAMCLTLCGSGNLLIVYRLHEFEHLSVAWWKNLPIRIGRRYFRMAVSLGIFLLPECIALLKYHPSQLYAFTVSAIVYLVSTNCLLLGLIQFGPMRIALFTKKVFFTMIVLLVVILFGAPVMVLAAVCLTSGFTLFMRNYYSFEPLAPGGDHAQ